jgi:hypothetical protein
MPKHIPLQTIVEKEGKRGVVCHDCMVCGDDETPVVWDCSDGFVGTNTDSLTVIGPENAVADPEKCGAGKGEDACKFLVFGAEGERCERYGSLRYSLMFRQMTAKREPILPYPQCQLEPRKE